jgi:hypothetical protein
MPFSCKNWENSQKKLVSIAVYCLLQDISDTVKMCNSSITLNSRKKWGKKLERIFHKHGPTNKPI